MHHGACAAALLCVLPLAAAAANLPFCQQVFNAKKCCQPFRRPCCCICHHAGAFSHLVLTLSLLSICRCCICCCCRALPAAAFLLSSTPIEMLGQATQLMISGKGAEQPVGELYCSAAAAGMLLLLLLLLHCTASDGCQLCHISEVASILASRKRVMVTGSSCSCSSAMLRLKRRMHRVVATTQTAPSLQELPVSFVPFCRVPAASEADEDGQQQPLQLDFPALAGAIASHAATDNEVKALCKDLQVLGRSEFKALLRWRLALRKDLKPLLGAAGEGEAAKQGSHKKQQQQQQGEDGEEQQQDAETKLLAEMEAVKDAAEQR
jgi:hypothetical protein